MSVKEFYGLVQGWLGRNFLVDKTPNYALDLSTLRRAEENFDNALYIHLIRHPSPSISSFEEAKLHVFFPPFFTGQHRFTPSQLGELIWVICHQNIRSFLQTIPAQRKRAVRFEELVRSPKKTMEELAEFLGLAFDPKMISPYDQDRRTQMTDAIHPMGRMLGDVKFHQHMTISAEAAQRRQGRFTEKVLGEVTRSLAGELGYNLRDRHHTLVGLQTRGVEKLLKRIGFRYANRIDPFDGGPHFIASTDEITLVARTRRAQVAELMASGSAPRRLCATLLASSPFIRVVLGEARDIGDDGVALASEAAEHLGVAVGDSIITLPLD